jgi:monoamine oxidase
MRETSDADCVVLGAGVAGLSAAHALRKQGVDVRVLEARDRVGGRTWSGVLDGAEVDWGGEWIGHGQPLVYALIKELGLRTFATYDQGRKVLEVGGRISTYTGTIPWMAPWKLIQIQAGIWRLDGLARGLAQDASWTHPRAAEWDATTLDAARRSGHVERRRAGRDGRRDAHHLRRRVRRALAAARARVHPLGGQPQQPHRHRGRLPARAHPRRRAGHQRWPSARRRRRPRAPRSTRHAHRPRRRRGGVRDALGDEWRARRVVVSVPIALGARIEFEPALPSAHVSSWSARTWAPR